MPHMSSELIAALIAAAVALGTGLITNAGRKDETDSTKLSTLIEGQAGRIEGLEKRLGEVETRLTQTETRLRRSQDHNHSLRRALSEALAWVIDALDWMRDDQGRPPPADPNFQEWRQILEHELN